MKSPAPIKKRKILFLLGLLLILLLITSQKSNDHSGTRLEDSIRLQTEKASSVSAVVNKGRRLPGGYIPNDLVTPKVNLRLASDSPEMQLRLQASTHLEHLFTSANNQGIKLMMASAYRSYDKQADLYNFYIEKNGQASADDYSARPGHSEHQTGLAVDIEPLNRMCELEECFATTPEGLWLADNAPSYGFIIRYEKNKKAITGYEYEPWHLRFLGIELAEKVKRSGLTLEEYFKLPAYSVYPTKIYELKN